jgi:hypothetical protein
MQGFWRKRFERKVSLTSIVMTLTRKAIQSGSAGMRIVGDRSAPYHKLSIHRALLGPGVRRQHVNCSWTMGRGRRGLLPSSSRLPCDVLCPQGRYGLKEEGTTDSSSVAPALQVNPIYEEGAFRRIRKERLTLPESIAPAFQGIAFIRKARGHRQEASE